MKKLFTFILCVMLFTGCNKEASAPASAANQTDEKTLQIVTTIFPVYDWVYNLTLGTNADITMLLDNGVDLHSFQPTAQDIMKIASCDLFIYVGGESDEWVEDALKEAVNPDLMAINLLEALGDMAKEEETVEGMEEEEEDHDHDEEEEETEYDEHVWLSLRNAAKLCEEITEALSVSDPEHAVQYEENLAAYKEKLAALDDSYMQAVKEAPVKTILFGDRFPFRYLTDDYGLSYYAAFAGCSAETEASFETIAFLSGKVDELDLSCVAAIDGSDGKIAQTIVQNTDHKDQKIITFNSMQNITGRDVEAGADYLSVMEGNLDALREALQ